MTIAISVEETLKRVYALSAMRSYLNSEERRIPMLTADNRSALRIMAADAFALVVAELMPRVSDCNVDDEDILSMTLRTSIDAGTYGTIIMHVVENMVAHKVLEAVLEDEDPTLSREYAIKAENALKGLRMMLDAPISALTRLKPYY